MNKIMPITMALVFLLIGGSNVIGCGLTKVPFHATLTPSSIVVEKKWTSPNGIIYAVESVTATMSGDLCGTLVMTVHVSVDPTTYIAHETGMGTITTSEGVYTILIVVTANIQTGSLSGCFVIQGTRNLRGVHIEGKITGVGNAPLLIGTKIVNH